MRMNVGRIENDDEMDKGEAVGLGALMPIPVE
jgi:hypothetical protein